MRPMFVFQTGRACKLEGLATLHVEPLKKNRVTGVRSLCKSTWNPNVGPPKRRLASNNEGLRTFFSRLIVACRSKKEGGRAPLFGGFPFGSPRQAAKAAFQESHQPSAKAKQVSARVPITMTPGAPGVGATAWLQSLALHFGTWDPKQHPFLLGPQ